ncbi:MAG: SDR family oxidoreductase [Solimonas sp.]
MKPLAPNPVVLVTGAARRVGAAIAHMQHAAGWNVVVHAHRSRGEGEEVVASLNALRADSARLALADLGDPAALTALARTAHASWGRLDALVNNASTFYRTPLPALQPAQIDDLLGSNLRGPLLLTQACALLFGDGAAVVNIVDTQLSRPLPGYSAYYAAKAGLASLTETLALELAPRVRVNAVAPGHTMWGDGIAEAERAAELARIPLGRIGGADEVARAARFLLSADAAYITGAILPVDGGLRLA